MTSSSLPAPGAPSLLNRSAFLWTLTAVAGQWIFFAYIAVAYLPTSLTGDLAAWNRQHDLITGYRPGDTVGNLAFALHALVAGVVSLGGALQLIPWIRRRAPAFHRWNGRVFLGTGILVSLTGFYMVWVRGSQLNLTSAIAVTGNGVVILACAGPAWRTALKRDFAAHRAWALRTFVVANGQWFFRVGFMGWMMTTRGLGHSSHMDGPFDLLWAFGCYLVPLAGVELYLRARSGPARTALALLFGAATLFMVVGIAGAALFMWAPVLGKG